MKKPSGLRGVVGQPVVTAAIIGIGLVALYQVYLAPDGWPLALVAIAIMGWTVKAHEEVKAYRAWKGAWDGMVPQERKARDSGNKGMRVVLAVILVVLVAIYLAANLDQPGYGFGLAWLVGGGALVLLVSLVRLAGRGTSGGAASRARQDTAVKPVAICVRGPLLPVPDLTNAYCALPEHCCKLLGITPRI